MTLVRTSVDAWVNENNPSQRYPQSVKLQMSGAAQPNRKFVYIFFARPFSLFNLFQTTVISATLRVNLAGTWTGNQEIIVKRITQPWREDLINWTNKPGVVDYPPGSGTHEGLSETITNAADRSEVEIDISEMLQDVADGSAWFGVRLSVTAASTRSIYSSDHPNTSLRPVLDCEWGETPDPPSNLAPGGGRAVSVQKPTLDWQFSTRGTGQNADSKQASSQVQISASTSFTGSLLYDSGKVANTDSRWELASTAYAGLSPDDIVFWRCRVWDDSDIPSDWSDTQRFTRKTKGTLIITNPGASPNNFVEELTPPINWDFTGRTQEAFGLTLYTVHTDGDRELFKVTKTTSGDNSYTLPETSVDFAYLLQTGQSRKKPVIKTGLTYRVRVRVFDTLDRQSIAGDPDYVVADRVFTYQRENSPSPVTSLVATDTGPRVTLTWTRATAPDYFGLRVNGEEVLHRIDPADVFVSGTTYQMDYWEAIPRAPNTYEVEAIVNNGGEWHHSGGNDTAVLATEPTGIWLVDPEDSRNVRIDDDQPADLEIREVGTTFDVVGSQRPVRITDSLMGYSGTISGKIISKSSRDDFLELKYRQKALRVILSDLNIPIVLEESSVPPTPLPGTPRIYEVSFACFQIDEFFETDMQPAGIIPPDPDPDPEPPPVTDDSAVPGEAIPGGMVPGT